MIHQKPIAMLGAGSWGTALALHLSRQGQTVHLWTIEQDHSAEMRQDRINHRFLPNHPFPSTLLPIDDLATALTNVDDIIIAVPSAGFRDILTTLKPLLRPTSRLLWVTKGLDESKGQLLHETLLEIVGNKHSFGALSGPSFAGEVAAGLPTAVVIASHDDTFASAMAERFNSSTFRVYLSHDIIGVEVGGAVKNVIAIATGISDGMQFGANARCALITRGLAEITRLAVALGARAETLTGLSGLGDLVLTCSDNQSRNRRFGLQIAEGKLAGDALREIGQVVEGRKNAEWVVALAKTKNIEMPIAETVHHILQGTMQPKEAMHALLSRETKFE